MKIRLFALSVVLTFVFAGCGETVRKYPATPLSAATEPETSEEDLSPRAKAVLDRIRQQEERLAAAEGNDDNTGAATRTEAETHDTGLQPLPPVVPAAHTTEAGEEGATPTPERVGDATLQPTVEQLIAYLESRRPLNRTQKRQLALLEAVQAGGDSESVLKAVADGSADSTFKELVGLTSAYRASDPDRTVEQLRRVENELRTRSSVSIHSPAFCTKVVGFGNYEPVKNHVFVRGRPALLYFEVRDFVCRPTKGGRYEYHLACQLTLLDRAGRTAGKLFNSDRAFFARSRLRDCHWPITFMMPRDIFAGDYVLKITLTDRLKNQVAEERVALKVR